MQQIFKTKFLAEASSSIDSFVFLFTQYISFLSLFDLPVLQHVYKFTYAGAHFTGPAQILVSGGNGQP